MTGLLRIFSLASCVLCAGCTIHRTPTGEMEVDWHLSTIFKGKKHKVTGADILWRQGYGFNNPNPERRKQGLPLLNFDGSEVDD